MNKVILMGRLTKDPEVRYINNNNTAVCNFTLAVGRKFQKETDFIPIVAWNKLAEFCGKYFTKGMRVAIVGSIQTRTWDDNKGNKHYATEILANEAYFADSKKDYSNTSSNNEESEEFGLEINDQEIPF